MISSSVHCSLKFSSFRHTATVDILPLFVSVLPMRLKHILSTLYLHFLPSLAALIDLTSSNRRPAIDGLPDWSSAGYEKGLKPLPDDSLVAKIISASQLASDYDVVANDGVDDTAGLQRAILGEPLVTLLYFHEEGVPLAHEHRLT